MKIVEIIRATIDNMKRQLIEVLGMGTDDVQEINQIGPFGVDSVPIKKMRGVQANTSTQGDAVIIGYINKNAIAESGETRLFSTNDDGELQIALHLKKDGTMEIGGNSDFMVRFNALEAGFNQLRSDHNTHTHVSNGTPPAIQSTASISAAKINEIKTS